MHYVPKTQTALRRAAYEGSLFLGGMSALPRERPDAILGVSPTLSGAVLASVASKVYRRPYGLLFQDLMGRAAIQSGVSGGSRVSGSVRTLERWLARQAASVGVIAGGFAPYFEEAGVDPSRIIQLRNWSQSIHHDRIDSRQARAAFGWGERAFVCLHAGNIGHKQGLDNLLRGAQRLNGSTRLVIAGDGNDRPRLEKEARRLRLQNVEFLSSQPSGQFEQMLAAADVLLVNQRASVGDMSLASKLTSYFAAARPIVAAVAARSETAREVEASRAGVVVPPDDARALADAITALEAEPDRAADLGRNGRAYAERELAPSRTLARYEDLVSGIAAASSSPAVDDAV
jgi:glycosyltransferase involved in cell wall biosynthesis